MGRRRQETHGDLQKHSLPQIIAFLSVTPLTHQRRKCSGAHFLLALPHLRLAVGGDGGQQVQHGQDGPRMDDHHVGRRGGGGRRVGGVGQVELQVRQGFDRSGRTRRTVVAVSGSRGEKEVIFR